MSRTLPAGEYYVGDLCYVLNSEIDDVWTDVCNAFFDNPQANIYELPDGRMIGMLSTAFGDGQYRGSDGYNYSVDSGIVGCILLSDLGDPNEIRNVINQNGTGKAKVFINPFTPKENRLADGGNQLIFDDLVIRT